MWKKTFHVDDDLLRQFILMVMITWDSLQGSSWWSWLLRKGSVHTLGNGSVHFKPVWSWGVFSPIPHLVESNVLGDVLGKLGGVAGLSRYRHYQSDGACVWFYSESFCLTPTGGKCETCLRGWRTCSGRSSSPWSTWSRVTQSQDYLKWLQQYLALVWSAATMTKSSNCIPIRHSILFSERPIV